MIIVNLWKDIKHDYKRWWGQSKVMPTCTNEYCKFANSLEFGSWQQMLARLGQSQWRIGISQWRNYMCHGFHNVYAIELLEISVFALWMNQQGAFFNLILFWFTIVNMLLLIVFYFLFHVLSWFHVAMTKVKKTIMLLQYYFYFHNANDESPLELPTHSTKLSFDLSLNVSLWSTKNDNVPTALWTNFAMKPI